MVFSSVTFLIYFLPVVIFLYYLAPARVKNLVLLVTSLFFYAWGEPIYIFLMIFSIIFNYISGICIAKKTLGEVGGSSRVWKAKACLAVNVILNLAVLGFFKYADFAIENINALMGTELSPLNLPLPIGISFYTFQAMSYVIDLYRGNVQVQKNLIAFGTYVTLFPQLIAGPIVRFKTVEEQLVLRKVTMPLFASGVRRFIIGMGKKVLLANNIGLLWESVNAMENGSMTVLTAWLGALAFTMQIYFDFSGYSDMAIGLGRMFGFQFNENFNYPYVSRSITEFWRRWHISLSSWFKEYVYVPLGGNQKGKARQLLNILIVWTLTGMWHGASWNFILWGAYFAMLLILEKLILGRALEGLRVRYKLAGEVLSHMYTMFFVVISWVIFASTDLASIFNYIESLFGFAELGFADQQSYYLLTGNLLLIGVCVIGATAIPKRIWNGLMKKMSEKNSDLPVIAENVALLILFMLSFAYIVASTYNPFLYFRF